MRHNQFKKIWYIGVISLRWTDHALLITIILQHDAFIAQDHLLQALIKDPSISAVLKEAGVTEAAIKTALEQARGNRRIESKNAEEGFDALNKYVPVGLTFRKLSRSKQICY